MESHHVLWLLGIAACPQVVSPPATWPQSGCSATAPDSLDDVVGIVHWSALIEGGSTPVGRVVSEVLVNRLGNPDPGFVFPGFTAGASLGVVS